MLDEFDIGSDEDFIAARDRDAAEARKERARGAELWRRLREAGEPPAWKDLILGDPAFESWGLCERLCHESAALADEDPGRAGGLAELALELVSRLSMPKARHAALQEYVWMHVGNVCRARGDLERAEEAFARAGEFFHEGMSGILPGVLERGRSTALEAALLRDRGSLSEALKKIDFAVDLTDDDSASMPELLLEKGRLQRRLSQPEKALHTLTRADELAAGTSGTRLVLRIQIELRLALLDLGRDAGFKELHPLVQQTAAKYPREQARLLCLDGRRAARRGRLEEAEAALDKLAADPARDLADLVLLSLEVAALYAARGKSAGLRELAERTQPLAADPKLGREAAATLKLFCRLVAQDKLSAERAAQFARDLARIV